MERTTGRGRDRVSLYKKQNELNSMLTTIIEEIQRITESGEEIIKGGIYLREITTLLLLK
jgi:hypothetical protein